MLYSDAWVCRFRVQDIVENSRLTLFQTPIDQVSTHPLYLDLREETSPRYDAKDKANIKESFRVEIF